MSKRPFIYSPNNVTGTIIEKAILINGIDYDFYGVVPPRRNQLTNGIDGGIVLLGYEGNKFSLNILYKKSFLYGMNKERMAHAKEDILILAPGPINRGVEVTPDVADVSFHISSGCIGCVRRTW